MAPPFNRRRNITPLFLLASAFISTLLLPARSNAMPVFARQFGVKCSTCHSPVPPRLNNLGIVFKRMGYRMPDADDAGRLILTNKPSRSAFDDLSLIGDVRGVSQRGEPFAFMLDEAEAMGAGSLNNRLSYALQAAYEDGVAAVEVFEGHLLLGRPTANVTARFGLLAPLLWDKGNTIRLTVSRPLLIDSRVRVGEFSGFRWRQKQPGAEVGVNLNRLGEGGALRSTFVSLGVFNGLSQGEDGLSSEENNDFKDVMFQTTHLWGESNTVGFMYYRGKATDIGARAFDDRIERWAVLGNYRLPTQTDFVAGVGSGRDTTTDGEIGRVRSRGWFLEVDQAIGAETVAALRYDRFEPDRAAATRDVRGPTLSVTHHLFDNLLLTAEYRGLRTGDKDRGRQVVFRAMVIY